MTTNDETDARTFIQRTRRDQLVGCAIEVLAKDGYANASMVRIAERAGVSRGVIPYHFQKREDLINAVVTEVYALATAQVRPAIDAQPNLRAGLRAFIVGSAEFYRDYPAHMAALYEIVTFTRRNEAEADGTGFAPQNSHELSAVGQLLRLGQSAGEFREFSAYVMARSIRGALDGLLIDVRTRDDVDIMAEAREIADLFDRAVRMSPPEEV